MGSSPIPTAGTVIATPGQPKALQEGEWQPSASPTVVSFEHLLIDPPSFQYVQTGEQLVINVNVLNGYGDTVTVSARLLLPVPPRPGQPDGTGAEGPPAPQATGASVAAAASAPTTPMRPHTWPQPAVIQQIVQVIAVTGGTPQTVKLPLQEGFLLSVAAVSASVSQRGQTFVRCWIQQRAVAGAGISAAMMLFADYCTQYSPTGWPGGRIDFPTEGPGYWWEQVISNPSAGQDWNWTNPTYTRTKIKHCGAQLATSSTVANRIVRIGVFTTGLVFIFKAAASAAITASTTAQFAAGPGVTPTTTDTTTVTACLPDDLWLGPGEQLRISTLNLQSGDQWNGPLIVTEQWIDNI